MAVRGAAEIQRALRKGTKTMTRYILNQPRDPAHESQEPQFTWWRIIEHNESTSRASRCIALIEDKTNAETIHRMFRFRHDALLEVEAKERPKP